MGLVVCLLLSKTGFIVTLSFEETVTEVEQPRSAPDSSGKVSMVLTSPGELCGHFGKRNLSRSGCHCSEEKKRSGTCCCSSGGGCCSTKLASTEKAPKKSCCSGSQSKAEDNISVTKTEKQSKEPVWSGCICGLTEFSFYVTFSQPMLKVTTPQAVSRTPILECVSGLEQFFDSVDNAPETPPPEVLS